jgi:hypothetical protein
MPPSLLEQLAGKQEGSKAGVQPAGPIEAVAVGSRDVRGHYLGSRLHSQPADGVFPCWISDRAIRPSLVSNRPRRKRDEHTPSFQPEVGGSKPRPAARGARVTVKWINEKAQRAKLRDPCQPVVREQSYIIPDHVQQRRQEQPIQRAMGVISGHDEWSVPRDMCEIIRPTGWFDIQDLQSELGKSIARVFWKLLIQPAERA